MKNWLWKLYAYRFFDDFVVIYPLYAVMFSESGVEPWQIATILGIWSLTSFLLEIPSGVMADKYPRKTVLFVGQIIRAVGYLIWLLFPNYWGFLIGIVLWGVKSAATSGTLQAYIYDQLALTKQEGMYTKIWGRTKTISFVAILLASFIASAFAPLGYGVILALSVCAVIVSGIMILLSPESKRSKIIGDKKYLSILREGLATVYKSPVILHLVVFLAFAYALGGALDEYWPLVASSTGIPISYLGIFIGIVNLFQGIASWTAYKIEKKNISFFYYLFVANGIFLMLSGIFFSRTSLFLLIVFSFLFTVIQIVFEGRLQSMISSESRATISSVSGFFTEIGVLLVYFVLGSVTQFTSYKLVLIFFGALIVGIGLIYVMRLRRID